MGWPFLKELIHEQPRLLDAPGNGRVRFLERVAGLIGASHSQAELQEFLTVLTQAPPRPPVIGRLAMLAGLADGLNRTAESFRSLLTAPPAAMAEQIQSVGLLLDSARQTAASQQEEPATRLVAIRILARATPEVAGKSMLDLLEAGQPAQVQSAAARAIAELNDVRLSERLFAAWTHYAAGTRRQILGSVPRSAAATKVLGDALENRTVSPVEVDPSTRQALLKTSGEQRQRFTKYFTDVGAAGRDEVVRQFQPALKKEGDRRRGAQIFGRTCLICHTIQGEGGHVGPDLSAVGSRPQEALLVDILDPSRQVPPDFITYTVETTDGKLVTGFIVSENATSVTLRGATEPDQTILRSQIKEMRAETKSLMPEGLEQGIGTQDMSDLLAFLQKPDRAMLSQKP